MKAIRKILVANRGEIAVRVIRTARRLGIGTVAIYSGNDRDSLHVSMAGEAWLLEGVELADTYLNIPKILDIARSAGCDAIHPGYGFLAENPQFVAACEEQGFIFIGPGAEAMQIMGNKIEARAFVKKLGIPMTDGVTGTPEELARTAHKIGFPVLLKAAAGGGGKGMRIVHDEAGLAEAIESTSRQARAYFGDETVYIEKYITEPRHIEVQILGDSHGNVIHLYERECSIQRRYQKIIEESPSPTLTPEVRETMGAAAVEIGKAIGYNNAGTVEFLVDRDLRFYFLEMNTRIQVEHPVTEMVTGIDLVEEQIYVAAGNPLRLRQEDIRQEGHAIECRIYAEDPSNQFQPSPGKMTLYREPAGGGIRIDTGITAHTEIKSSFDPMICKLVAHGRDRHDATLTMLGALNEYVIHGIRTNIAYLISLLRSEAFVSNRITTRFCDEHTPAITAGIAEEKERIPIHVPALCYLARTVKGGNGIPAAGGPGRIWESVGYWRLRMSVPVEIGGNLLPVDIPLIHGNEFEFVTGGETHRVAVRTIEENLIELSIGHNHYRAWISEDPTGEARISLGEHIFTARRRDILPESVFAAGPDRHGSDSDHVTAPMPGKVVRILTSPGTVVKKGDPLLIIEAMKMENHVTAPRDAKVKTVNVALNDRVEGSTVLVEFEESNL